MQKIDPTNERLLMHKLNNGGWTNLYEWLENICNKFYEEQAIEERDSLIDVNKIFYDEFHESFFVTIPKLLFKLLIENEVVDIVEVRPPLETRTTSNWE